MWKKIIYDIKNNPVGFAVAVICISTCWAGYHGDSPLGAPLIRELFVYVRLGLLLAIYTIGLPKLRMQRPLVFLLTILYSLVSVFYKAPGFNGEQRVVFSLLMLALVSLAEKEQLIVAFKYLKWFLVVTGAIGIITYISFLIGLPLPHEIVPYYAENMSAMGYAYVDYGISYLVISADNGLRLCGLFNEPGYFGTFAAMILIIERLNLRKKENVILLIASVLTFSFAFFVVVGIYFILSRLKINVKSIALILIVLCIPIYVLPNIHFSDPNLQSLVDRFSVQDGKLAGDNRNTEDFMDLYEHEMSNPTVFWFGKGTGYISTTTINSSNASIRNIIIQYGYFGLLFFYGLLFLIAWKEISKCPDRNLRFSALLYIILFYISLYQRPYLYALNYFILFFGGIYYILASDEYNKNEYLLR